MRQIIQIATFSPPGNNTSAGVCALANDGTLWHLWFDGDGVPKTAWQQLPEIPEQVPPPIFEEAQS